MRRIALALLAASVGCMVAGGDSFRTLANGGQSGIHGALRIVITDEAEWTRFWSGHVSNQTSPPAAPAVDFAKERVVAVYLGAKPNACHGVEIRRVASDRVAEVTTVEYAVREPRPDESCAQVVTYPHHVAAIPAAPTEVQWTETRG